MIDKEDIKKIRRWLEEGYRPGMFAIEKSGAVSWYEILDVVEDGGKWQILGKHPKSKLYATAWIERGKWNGVTLDEAPVKTKKSRKRAKAVWDKKRKEHNEN